VNTTQKNNIKLIIAEDQELMRKSFIALLKEDQDFEIIAEASNGKELLEILKHTTPDVVLLDIEMPVMNGREALEIINKRFPDVKVIMLSMHAGPHFISELMARGARAFLPKNCDPDALFEAIHTVSSEGYYFDKSISEAMLRGLQREKSINPLLEELSLSDRETEILKEICEGKTNRQIAEALNISIGTVDFHRGNIYKKTRSKNLVELLKYAIKNGIISLT
jgi:DNA-binding NarL/FixJ family response regulator